MPFPPPSQQHQITDGTDDDSYDIPWFICFLSNVQKYFKSIDAGASAPATSSTTPAVSLVNASSPVAGLTELQQQMVQQFSVQSSMNAAYSARYGSHSSSTCICQQFAGASRQSFLYSYSCFIYLLAFFIPSNSTRIVPLRLHARML